ncbi:hypothetical protein IV203_027756 [Nitzschia inconspicua]|uniref:START domain-containing protein n=1 Tax=Nitzschia inconspicua TaxID=303405 RepID=A0A9K3LWZ7_9STRA|nr:hypothetical protein IV203_027756 [Nitzschia inconspicua]
MESMTLHDGSLDKAVEGLVQEERHLAAARLLRRRLDTSKPISEDHRKLLRNADVIERAVAELLSSPKNDWIKQGESHGKNGDFTIYYKIQEGAKLTCRIESPIPTSHLVPLLSVLNESGLYHEWIPTFHRPFKLGVTSSKQLVSFSRGHQVIQVQCSVPYPIYPREALFDVVAIDDIDENGYIIAKMTTVTEGNCSNLPDIFDFPGVTTGFERCDFDGAVLFRACPTDHANYESAKRKCDGQDLILTTFSFHFDARLRYIPQALINFVTREALDIIWNMLLNVAEQVRDGTRTQHCEVIAQKKEFYEWVKDRCQFMLDKMKSKSDDRHSSGLSRNSPKVNVSCDTEECEEKKDDNWTMQDILRLNT